MPHNWVTQVVGKSSYCTSCIAPLSGSKRCNQVWNGNSGLLLFMGYGNWLPYNVYIPK